MPEYRHVSTTEEQRDKAEATLEMVAALADGYSWLADGRGPYSYDDGRYDDDVRQFVGQLLDLLPSTRWLGMREWEARYRKTDAERDALLEAATAIVRWEDQQQQRWKGLEVTENEDYHSVIRALRVAIRKVEP